MIDRRGFLTRIVAPLGAAAAVATLDPKRARAVTRDLASATEDPTSLAADETYWFEAQQAFTVDRSIVNFNNGGVSPSPAVVQEAMKRRLDFSNSVPPPHALGVSCSRRRKPCGSGWHVRSAPKPRRSRSPATRRRDFRRASSASTCGKATRC